MPVSDIATHARWIADHLPPASPLDGMQVRQVMAVAEAAGLLVAAYRRHAGIGQRAGTRDEVATQLAALVITAYVAADSLGVDLTAALETEMAVVHARTDGQRETS